MTPAAGPASAVALHGITKRFPGVLANDAISLALHGGEVHALLGENGAGKSTLIGILAGMQQPDEGHIEIAGARVCINSPRHSLRLRIGTVFQHVLLVNSLTVIENLMLGGAWWRRHDRRAALGKFGEISQLLGVDIDAHVPAGRLSLGQQQQVEIIRALWHGGNVLVLDEPTSMLAPGGVKELGGVMRRLAEQGVAIVFVTHKLREAYAFGDRISVLRRGRLVGDIAPERLRAMAEEQATAEIIRLMFEDSDGADDADSDAATLMRHGHGRRPRAEFDRSARRRLGVRYISDERLGEATVAGHSVATNLVLKEIGAPPYWQGGMTQWRRIFSHARQVIEDHDIRTPSEHTLLGRLSGGNIQKLLLAREISTDTSVVIFNKPTHGLDLHNTRLARQRIIKSAESGIATIVISTELDELLELCHRIGVMFAGELSGIVDNQAGAEAQIGRLMTGAKAA